MGLERLYGPQVGRLTINESCLHSLLGSMASVEVSKVILIWKMSFGSMNGLMLRDGKSDSLALLCMYVYKSS